MWVFVRFEVCFCCFDERVDASDVVGDVKFFFCVVVCYVLNFVENFVFFLILIVYVYDGLYVFDVVVWIVII